MERKKDLTQSDKIRKLKNQSKVGSNIYLCIIIDLLFFLFL